MVLCTYDSLIIGNLHVMVLKKNLIIISMKENLITFYEKDKEQKKLMTIYIKDNSKMI